MVGSASQLVSRVKELRDHRSAGRRRGRSPPERSRRRQAATRRRWTRRQRAIPTLTAPGEADAFVAARLAEGSDFIKIIYDDTSDAFPERTLPTLDEATVAALVTSAHARGRIAVAHIGNERYARGAIAAGVDGLAHLFVGSAVSTDFGQFAAKHGVFVIPTLSVLYAACGMPDGPGFLKEADTMK